MKRGFLGAAVVLTLSFAVGPAAHSQEVFIGNPGKSLNFFIFDLALEKGYFRELGLDAKLLNTSATLPLPLG